MLWWPVIRLFHPRVDGRPSPPSRFAKEALLVVVTSGTPAAVAGYVCISTMLCSPVPRASRPSSFAIRAEKRKKRGRMSVMGVSSYAEVALAPARACAFRLFSRLSPCFPCFPCFWIFFVSLPFLEGDCDLRLFACPPRVADDIAGDKEDVLAGALPSKEYAGAATKRGIDRERDLDLEGDIAD